MKKGDREMKIVGTIVEYNPLHNGHVYAIEQIRKESKADILVAVLSGNFTMRGNLSMFSKFDKTRQALRAGMDILIELPFVYAVQNSELFAKNSVSLLNLIGVEELWIGSEQNDPSLYEVYYKKWNTEENQNKIKDLLAKGKSYKEATASIIDLPSNDLLGYSYYKAIQENHYPITIKTIQRIGSFNSKTPEQFASAYAIRQNPKLMAAYCPSYISSFQSRDEEQLFPYIKYSILNSSKEELKEIFFVEEGLEHKLEEIKNFSSIQEFVDFLATKRYTKSRIQRMLLYILFDIKKVFVEKIKKGSPEFVRILGYSPAGLTYLSSRKKQVKLYTNLKNGIHPVLDLELKITKILDFIYQTEDFKQEQAKPITIEESIPI